MMQQLTPVWWALSFQPFQLLTQSTEDLHSVLQVCFCCVAAPIFIHFFYLPFVVVNVDNNSMCVPLDETVTLTLTLTLTLILTLTLTLTWWMMQRKRESKENRGWISTNKLRGHLRL